MRRGRGAQGRGAAASLPSVRSSSSVLVLSLGLLLAGCLETSTGPTEPDCSPVASCVELRPACGAALDDGCGGFIDCSTCDDGMTCVSGLCECPPPPTCASVRGVACGSRPNACGPSVECGLDCPFGTVCVEDTGLCGTPCDVATDCPGLGSHPGTCNQTIATCQNTPACDRNLCGTWQLDTEFGPVALSCGCPPNRTCDAASGRCLCDAEAERAVVCEGVCGQVTICDGSIVVCDAATHASTVCDGRCGEVTLCGGAPVTCPTCALGTCDPAQQRCRAGVRPAGWEFDPVQLLSAAAFSGRAPQAVTALRRPDGIELWIVAGHNQESRLYRVELEADGRTVRGAPTEAPAPPPEYAYPYAGAPVVSLDGARLWILHSHSDASLPRLHVAEIDPVTRALAPSRPAAIGLENVLSFVPIRDSRTALVATWEPNQATVPELPARDVPPYAGLLHELGRYSTTPAERGYPLLRGQWRFDEPSVREWVDEAYGNQIGGIQRGCEGLSITFDWVEGGVLESQGGTAFAGLLELDGDGLPGERPVRPLPLHGLGLISTTPTVSLSELPGCDLAFVVTDVSGGALHVATPTP